jgi:predicted nucleic acid-binding protein
MSDDGLLIFIDTNIFLDFYRATGSADFKLLGRLKAIHDRIITSAQVEMEVEATIPKSVANARSMADRTLALEQLSGDP